DDDFGQNTAISLIDKSELVMAVSLPLVLRGSSTCKQHEILNTNSRDTEIYGPKILLSSVWRGCKEHAYAVRSLDRHLLDYQVCSRRVQKALMRFFDANRIEVRGAPTLSGSMRALGIEWVPGNDNGRILSTAIVVLQNDISGRSPMLLRIAPHLQPTTRPKAVHRV
ncbi:hypothetical protein E4U57_007832, partial [Claviceps arundinis]